MGRRAKYATLNKYRPYIDIIRRDLNIPDAFFIQWQFKNVKRVMGESFWYGDSARIVISNNMSHRETLKTIAHELRHTHQRITERLVHKKGNIEIWDGKEYIKYSSTRKKEYSAYTQLPWELDACNYEEQVLHLFPKYKLPIISRREYIGNIGNSKYYKIKDTK